MVISILFAILLSYVASRYDGNLIKRGIDIDHNLHAAIRGGFIVLTAFLSNYPPVFNTHFIYEMLLSITIQCFVFWIFFDILLNQAIGNELMYLGKSSKLDKWASKIHEDLFDFTVTKFGLFVIFVVLERLFLERLIEWIATKLI